MSSRPIPPTLFWFLGAFLAHALVSTLLFAVSFGMPDGRLASVLMRAFAILQLPVRVPLLSSLLWAVVVAGVVGVMRRRRDAALRR